jgi:hypothetical protein
LLNRFQRICLSEVKYETADRTALNHSSLHGLNER